MEPKHPPSVEKCLPLDGPPSDECVTHWKEVAPSEAHLFLHARCLYGQLTSHRMKKQGLKEEAEMAVGDFVGYACHGVIQERAIHHQAGEHGQGHQNHFGTGRRQGDCPIPQGLQCHQQKLFQKSHQRQGETEG